ncbi:MAG TPA: bifunctional nicotinamidase/pyrazinamidase [Candidatus Bathyarchaeia archaeon]|nr:bifunctional nicotinamidase/pyrazinamidase [Candidatus Bathyarchaeia archaeon]
MKKDFKLGKNDALVIVDVQRDFCPGGALPVPAGDQVVPVLNDYIKMFKAANAGIFATRDWHPPNHMSFKVYGGPWPPHCIQNSEGAQFHPDLKLPDDTSIISKAMDPSKESYSGFDGTMLSDELKKGGVTRVFVGGLATDYCVKNTVLDAIERGFETVLLLDATRGINVKPGDVEKAIDEMVAEGAEKVTLADFPESPEIPQEEPVAEKMEEKPLTKAEKKKKARLRSRGPYRKARIER